MTKRSSKPAEKPMDNSIKYKRMTLSALGQQVDLWYKIHVLLYDLSNVASDTFSEKRLSSTTHELYISEPYFNDSEATIIRTALIDDNTTRAETSNNNNKDAHSPHNASASHKEVTVEDAIHNQLSNFFDKRKASGDARPCGPHDMVPIYAAIFGIQKEELKDEGFLSRLKRSGLGDCRRTERNATTGKDRNTNKGRKKAGRAH